ncbi:uncharacterized protein LOC117675782 [Pantherophis guttatus]|uniref:Gypsy retrotransposon integrase-like protein 1 n=1 Tax=Pantherophis guttatus TaxID=94885 RepID=A0ABM3YZE6_PANGU|nr:uncharacterized protein LOC117675782 [Pantherophis guttatus]
MAPPTFAPYNAAAETWDAYEERFECFLEANDFTDLSSSKKRAHFLNACGPEVFATARALLAPQPVHTTSWEVLRQKLRAHYAPIPSCIARRFNLRQILQEEGEPVNHYVARLRTAAIDCEFRDLEDALVEQLVCGVRDINLQKRLLAKKTLDLQMAMEEAQAAEMSDKSAADICKCHPSANQATAVHSEEVVSEDDEEEPEVSRIKTFTEKGGRPTRKKPPPSSCLSCGDQHPRTTCRFRSVTCRRCGKLGHLARVCRLGRQRQSTFRPKGAAVISEDCFAIFRGRRVTELTTHRDSTTRSNKLFLTVKIEGVPCRMEVDTGSSKSIVSWTTIKEMMPSLQKNQLHPSPVKLRDYQGNRIPIIGHGRFLVEYDSFTGRLPLIVVDGSLPSLLGLDWFGSFGLAITGIHSTSSESDFDMLASEFKDVFNDALGKYVGSPISLNLDPNIAPIRLKPRRVPLALRPKVEAELDKLIAQGVLEPTDHSQWETLAKLDLAQAYQQLPVDEASAEAQTIVTHRGAFKCKRYLIDATGIHPTPSKVAAIKNAAVPTCKADLQAFLGLLNFYSVFLPHKATLVEPLHRLLDKNTPWSWGEAENRSFRAVQDLLTSSAVLVQYSSHLPLVITADASPFGIGAVLSHRFPNGIEAPIAYYSRTLSSTERKYSQLDREALAAVASVKKFHDYIYGRHFDLVTDHKPLLGLLAGDHQTPLILSPRMSRWTEFLAAYNYTLRYRPGKEIAHADALSRCPLPLPVEDPAPTSSVLLVEELPIPLSATDVAAHSAVDPLLAQVLDWVARGWPLGQVAEQFKPFRLRQHELSVLRGCLLWGHRVVIPPKLRNSILECLHEAHPGIIRMKGLSRSYVWWPGIDQDITDWVAKCQTCQLSRPAAPSVPPREWEFPRAPWSRVHLDFAGPFMGRQFLIVVDAYSRWVEVEIMPSITSEAVIRVLNKLFATHGLPDVLVSDNGPQLTSAPFQMFLASLGIRHAQIAPYCPSSNGLAERAVRSTKEALARLGPRGWQERVSTYLLSQHTTPCSSTNRSPAEMLMGRRLRTTLDRLHPLYNSDRPTTGYLPPRVFKEGDQVFARNYGGDPRWLPGQIIQVTGPCSYRVLLVDGRTWRRHVDQLRKRVFEKNPAEAVSPSPTTTLSSMPGPTLSSQANENLTRGAARSQQWLNLPEIESEAGKSVTGNNPSIVPLSSPSMPESAAPVIEPELRRSGRTRRRPAYLNDYTCVIQEGRGVMSSRV